jgi:NADH-ubiquinone oxidoreductase chain 1
MLSIISILEGLLLIVPALLSVAFVTIAERKTMASMQRRLGPNAVGYYGLLQAFADALKLLLKEYVAPTQANIILFFLGPMITLIFALLGYLVVPYGSGIFVSDYSLGMLYMLAVSSLATYGILLAGWSANSKYAFLGSLRSTAQLISYELILSSVILLVILLTGNLNMITIVESQRIVNFLLPLFPLFIVFFIGSIAETNRAPFDLAEAESELVSGFMTEHSASIFVFFFLAEYASIVLICILNSILFLGGYLCIIPVNLIIDVLNTLLGIDNSILEEIFVNISSSPLNLAVKTTFLVFVFIWVRASFPRIRFDQLMSFCWTVLLPLIIAYVVLLPCVVYGLDALPTQILL